MSNNFWIQNGGLSLAILIVSPTCKVPQIYYILLIKFEKNQKKLLGWALFLVMALKKIL